MENLTGLSSLQAVCQKFSDGVEIAKCISGFIKEVGETELCYSSCLEKLLKSPFYNFHSNFMTQFLGSTPYQELGTLKHTWEKLGEELNILARLHAEKAVAYQDSVRKPLIELMPLLEEKRKEFRNRARQLKTDLDAAEAKHLKERTLYHKMADNMEQQKQAKGDSGPKAFVALKSLGKREVKIEDLMIQAAVYKEAHNKHIEATENFNNHAVILLEDVLEMESTRVDTVKNCLKEFATILSNTAPAYSGVMQRLTISVEQISAVKDVRMFVKQRQQIEDQGIKAVPELELRQNSNTSSYAFRFPQRPTASAQAVRKQNRSSQSVLTLSSSAATVIKVPDKTPSVQTTISHSDTVKPKCSSGASHDLTSTSKVTSEIVRCNPLVIDNVLNDVTKHFHWSRFKDDIVIEAPEILMAQIKDVFTMIISKNESQITTRQKSLSFHYYPLLMSTCLRDQMGQIINNKLEFKVEHHGKIISLTELQNISSSSRESCHQWYWFDGHTFVAYDSQVNAQIESAFVANIPTLQVSIRSQSYLIDISKSKQMNMTTKNSRDIQRRLTSSRKNLNFKLHLTSHEDSISQWEDCIMDLLQSFIVEETVQLSDSICALDNFMRQLINLCSDNIVEAVWEEESKLLCLRGSKDRVILSKKKIQDRIIAKEKELQQISTTTSLPSSWTPQTENCELKIVPWGTSEWKYVEKIFTQGFQVHIVNIERIQNKWLWNDYAHARKKMITKNAKIKDENEKYLFHGTRKNPPKDIYNSEQGFDHRMASKGLLGEGIYFAATSKYSADGYAYTMPNGYKQVFLVRVLTGVAEERTQSDRSLKAPSKKPLDESRHGFEGERYDSVTAFTGGSQIYVIYDQGRAYPDYLITYLTPVD